MKVYIVSNYHRIREWEVNKTDNTHVYYSLERYPEKERKSEKIDTLHHGKFNVYDTYEEAYDYLMERLNMRIRKLDKDRARTVKLINELTKTNL